MSKSEKPEEIRLSASEAEALTSRIESGELSESDKSLLLGLIKFSLWLEQQLSLAKLSIHKLKGLFGIKTEKKSPKASRRQMRS